MITQTKSSAPTTYRKTKTGEWVVYGPAFLVRRGESTAVRKANGDTKTERIERVGKEFDVDGVKMVYGYLAAKTAPAARQYSRPSQGRCSECGNSGTCFSCRFNGNDDWAA